MNHGKYALVLATLLMVAGTAGAGVIEFVTVGNTGNIADTSPAVARGAVNYEYQIGKYEITQGQYAVFLNAVAALEDTYGLFTPPGPASGLQRHGMPPGPYTYSTDAGWADRPVNSIDFGNAARFANWMHNGQPTGLQNASTTEDGAYTLNGAISAADLGLTSRNPGAKFFVPTADEWHKAAYHKNNGDTGDYWLFPVSTDGTPPPAGPNIYNDVTEATNTGMNANVNNGGYAIGSPLYVTEVGTFAQSMSPYGAFDMAGNVDEITETFNTATTAMMLGGNFIQSDTTTMASYGASLPLDNTVAGYAHGFRLATVVPEPATLCLLAFGGLLALRRRRYRRRRFVSWPRR